MAHCKDCIHVEVCREYIAGLAAARGVELDTKELETVLECDDCEYFKDRSRFVELPRSLENDVFFVRNKRILRAKAISYLLAPYQKKIITTFDDFSERDIGETVFFSREAAEQALKERES